MTPLLISIVAFVLVAGLVGGVAFLLRGDGENRIEDRLAQLTGAKVTAGAKENLLKASGVLTKPLDATQGVIEVFLGRFRNLSLWFDQAEVTIAPIKFFGFCGALGIGATVALAFTGAPIATAPVAGVFAGFIPVLWLSMKRKRRFGKFAKQLPDALELIARALRAGHSLASGFSLVADEMKAPIGSEFRRAYEEQNLGVALDDALKSMTKRMPNLDLKFFVTAVVLQRQTGGDLAEILDKIGRLVRDRFAVWGAVQALTGEGRLSGIVLLALPPVLFVAVWRLNPDYVMPLFTDPMGRQMLLGAVVMQFLGAAVIRKIINIKV